MESCVLDLAMYHYLNKQGEHNIQKKFQIPLEVKILGREARKVIWFVKGKTSDECNHMCVKFQMLVEQSSIKDPEVS